MKKNKREKDRNNPEYQKVMRQMRRNGMPPDLADKAALGSLRTWPTNSVMKGWKEGDRNE